MHKITGIYRDTATREVMVVGQDEDGLGVSEAATGLPFAQAEKVANIIRSEVAEADRDGTDWYVTLTDANREELGSGPADPGEQGEHQCGPDCTCEVDFAEAGESGDESGDESGEEEDNMPSEAVAKLNAEDIIDNMRDSQPEDLPIDHPLGQDIWELIKPNVEQLDEHTATVVATAVAQYVSQQPQPSGPGAPVKCDHKCSGGGVTIKVADRQPVPIPGGLVHEKFDTVARIIAAKIPVMLVGPPGTGKTFMAQQVCDAMGLPYALQSFTPQTTESAIKGFIDAGGTYRASAFRGVFDPDMTPGAYILDEGDNCSPPVMTGLNSAMANRYMQFADAGIQAADEFQFIMTANTWGTGPTAEFAGRAKLDPATLNRFAKVYIGTDTHVEDEVVTAIIGNDKLAEDWLRKIRHIRTAVEGLGIKHFVTMRDAINGANLIRPGEGAFTTLEALQVTCLGPLTDDQQTKVKAFRA